MMSRIVFFILMLATPIFSRADGVTDFLVDPVAGVTLAESGSYRLAGNVTMTTPGVYAITVTAPNVTIDLNGHTLDGGELGTGLSVGVSSTQDVTVVRNGGVKGFGGVGVNLAGLRCIVSEVTVNGCSSGINIGDNGVVEKCIASQNTSVGNIYGIQANNNCIVRDCIAEGNTTTWLNAYGIKCYEYCQITGNVAGGNTAGANSTAYGIYAFNGGRIQGNTCNSNVGESLSIGIGNTSGHGVILDNTCDDNHGGGTDGSGRGIIGGIGSRVAGNVCVDNDAVGAGTAYGITISSNSHVERNQCTGNSGGAASYGIFVSSGNTLVRENSTGSNGTAGIRLNVAGIRCELNRMGDTVGISDAGGNSIGSGDLANITY